MKEDKETAVLDKCYRKNPDIAFRKVAGEFILVPIRRNVRDLESIYTLNEVATRVWDLIDGKRTGRQISEVIGGEFDVEPKQAEIDVCELLQNLHEIGGVRKV